MTAKKSRLADAPAVDPELKKRAQRVYRKLAKTYPDAKCALEHDNAYELLIATILSAQTTDERVNQTTPQLFEAYPTVEDLAEADPKRVEKLIQSTGFYRNKTKSIIGAAKAIVEHHDGEVPDTMEELIELPGVARKTANVVLGNAFGKNVGVVVDTHVRRLSQRLGFTGHDDPKKIERYLMAAFPKDKWTMLSHLLIFHGRQICIARKPKCSQCPVESDCPKIGVEKSA